jgi:hypothetical protein
MTSATKGQLIKRKKCSHFGLSVIQTQRRYGTLYKKDPPSDYAIRRWLQHSQETGCSVPRRSGRTEHAQDVGSPHKSTRPTSLQLFVYHKRLFGALFITAFTLCLQSVDFADFKPDLLFTKKGSHVEVV